MVSVQLQDQPAGRCRVLPGSPPVVSYQTPSVSGNPSLGSFIIPRVPSAFKAQAGPSPAAARPAAPIPSPDVVQLAFPHLVDLRRRRGKTPGGGERDPGVSRTLDRFLRSVSFESLSARHPGPSWEPLRDPSSRRVNRESLAAQPSHKSSMEASALLRI